MSIFFVLRSWGRLLYIFVWIKYGCKMFGGNRIQQWISSWGKLLPAIVSHIRLVFGATVSWLLNLIGNCFGFAFLRSMIGQKKSRHFINQSNSKLNPVASWLTAFSRAAGCWLIFTLISHWLLNQSNSKLKPAASWLTAFSRAAGSWLIFTLISH